MAQIKITQTSNADINIGVSKQTAVDWLVKKYFEDYNVLLPELEYEQAKQMEKEQIEKAYSQGYKNAQNYIEIGKQEYYNETYNNETTNRT